jgi:hypothetical protein
VGAPLRTGARAAARDLLRRGAPDRLTRLVASGLAAVLASGAAALVLVEEPPVRRVVPVTVAAVAAEAPPPVGVTVPRLGVQRQLVRLRTDAAGVLQVPEDPEDVGWWRDGPAPGEAGPAVLVGHVDSYEGGAVFFRLRELEPGDVVEVLRADRSVVAFEVYASEAVPKDAFPTERVYGPTQGAELRVITCGGSFDEKTRSYTENVVVYLRQVGPPTLAAA